MTNYVFYEPRTGYVGHAAASKLLVVSPPIPDLVGCSTGENFPAAAKLVEMTQKFGASEEMDESGFNLAFNTDLPIMRFYD